MPTRTLAIDFGTSNSAAAMWDGTQMHRLPIEAGAETLPTAVFFASGGGVQIGRAATQALIDGEDGRFLRALKSVMGLPLAHEARVLGGKRRTLMDVTAEFLSKVKTRSEAAAGQSFDHVLSGRPVHFHTRDADKDVQAEADLLACYQAAGFDEVSFLPEPEAAALACQGLGDAAGLGLIVDIGGGTSDFTVFETLRGRPRIVVNHGIRLGGTDFDQLISLAHVMPLLGMGTQLRREFGDGLMPVPRAPYLDLATWAKIPFLYTREMRLKVDEMAKLAMDREGFARLTEVLEAELGHDIAFAVEAGKITANGGQSGGIDLSFLERDLQPLVSQGTVNAALSGPRDEMRMAIYETLQLAQVRPDQISRVILVGGSSLMGFVEDEARGVCAGATVLRSEAFTAVVDGLALAAAT